MKPLPMVFSGIEAILKLNDRDAYKLHGRDGNLLYTVDARKALVLINRDMVVVKVYKGGKYISIWASPGTSDRSIRSTLRITTPRERRDRLRKAGAIWCGERPV
mgnify:CR=1 FL=1